MAQFGSANDTTKLEQGIQGLAFSADQIRLNDLNTAPATASDTGVKGEIRIDASHIYVCTATDTWVRAAIATW